MPYLLRWRSRRIAVRYLEVLSLAVRARGWRCVKLYGREFPTPLLWVYASGVAEDVGVVVSARAVPNGLWAYHDAKRGRAGYLAPCGDAKAAAEQVDLLLKRRMFPSTW
ncbi:hypothetical protein E1293_22805 [Actinomadura darangshiensis]|uniref:Uncharacterized protein n=1 Tax=Actinomadura darangshiensis TaxID=705336 RepID=A0A4R5B7K5_9ACTN|nr:hypothetical protein [Actinomadura darangshiensis]TDD79644.1 hypothetical protein E1293_22805 [Actinomadura darangshiensis]